MTSKNTEQKQVKNVINVSIGSTSPKKRAGDRASSEAPAGKSSAAEKDGPMQRPALQRSMLVIGADAEAHILAQRAVRAGYTTFTTALPGVGQAWAGEGVTNLSELVDAVSKADIVLVAMPALSHSAVAAVLVDSLTENATVVAIPGQTGGALQLAAQISARHPNVVIAETAVLPFIAGPDSTGEARVLLEFSKVPVAALPSSRTPEVVKTLKPLFDAVAAEHVLSTSLQNPYLTLATAPLLMSVGTSSRTLSDLMTHPAIEVLSQVDAERQAVGRAYGMDLPSIQDWLLERVPVDATDSREGVWEIFRRVPTPGLYDPGWLLDAVPNGLVPLIHLAQLAGVEVPVSRGVTQVASAALRAHFMISGRGLDRLGMLDVTKDELVRKVRT